MAFTQFPQQQYFRVFNTGENAKLGYFNLQDGVELKHVMLTIFIRGAASLAGTERVRMKIYGNDTLESAIITSDWANLNSSTLDPVPVDNWLGNIYLDFQGNPLNPNINYFMTAEIDGYTRNANSFYIGVNLDWYSPVNTQLTAGQAGARIRILGKR